MGVSNYPGRIVRRLIGLNLPGIDSAKESTVEYQYLTAEATFSDLICKNAGIDILMISKKRIEIAMGGGKPRSQPLPKPDDTKKFAHHLDQRWESRSGLQFHLFG